MWKIVEIIDNNSKFIIGCAYFRPNLNNDECINLLQASLDYISDSYQNHKIIIVEEFSAHIGNLNHVEGEL